MIRLAAFALLLLLATGCTKLVEEEPTPTPLATPAEANKPIFTAKRTSIVESVKGLGRVAATDEATLYFKQTGRLKKIYVELNQPIKKGDVLAELEIGQMETQVNQARINHEIAALALQRAVEKSNQGDPSVRSAQAAIARAEVGRANAQAALARSRAGATGAEVQTVDAATTAAEAALERTQADLSKLKAPKSPDEVAAARGQLEKARVARAQAQAAYDRIASRSDSAGRPEGVVLQQATAEFEAAQARLNLATQGAKPEEITASEKAVASAEAALESARARADQVRSGPLPADVNTAAANVRAAEANIATLQAEFEKKMIEVGLSTASYDVQIAQKQLELANVSLKTLEEQLADTRLIAPFDGIVTDTRGREGDQIVAYTPVVVTANPTSILVAVELNPQDLAKVKLGMPAIVTMDAFKGQRFETTVVGLPAASTGPQPQSIARTVKLGFTPPGKVELGALASITITTQKKENVVTVPNAALRRFGGRKYVQTFAENGRKREVDVETGIQTDVEVEIVKGIAEGARVISQ